MLKRHPASKEINAQAPQAAELIRSHGFYVQHILPTDETLGFSYTVGLPDYIDHPEIFAMSLPREVALNLFNILVEKINLGDVVVPGQVLSDISNLPCILIPADERVKKDLPLEAIELCTGKSDYDVMQLVWSDQNSRFPHHPDFNSSLKHVQPVYSNVSLFI